MLMIKKGGVINTLLMREDSKRKLLRFLERCHCCHLHPRGPGPEIYVDRASHAILRSTNRRLGRLAVPEMEVSLGQGSTRILNRFVKSMVKSLRVTTLFLCYIIRMIVVIKWFAFNNLVCQ